MSEVPVTGVEAAVFKVLFTVAMVGAAAGAQALADRWWGGG